jgi:hypothetical protein
MTTKTALARRAVLGLALSALLVAGAAQAHHGWTSYNAERPIYLEGTVAEVQWRNPHPEVVVVVASPAPAVDPSKVRPASDSEGAGVREALAKAQAAAPGRYTVHLPPIARIERAGVSAPPKHGERLVAVAFPSCSEAATARAAFVGLANGTSAVQQVSQAARGCNGAPRS